MFDPDDDWDPPSVEKDPKKNKYTSYGRFYIRIEKFKRRFGTLGYLVHAFWWLLHNLVAHLFIGLIPIKESFKFHDWTSDQLNRKEMPPTYACAHGFHRWAQPPHLGAQSPIIYCEERGCNARREA